MEFHWEAVHSGEVTILDLLDSLSYYRIAPDGHPWPPGFWKRWRAFLCAVYGLPMDREELATFRACTGRQAPPTKKAREVWMGCGRRARKSAIAALIGFYEGAYRDHRANLAPGEMARVPIVAKDMDDAGAIFGYLTAIAAEPALRHLIAEEPTGHVLKLTTQVELVVRACKLTAGRSRAVAASLNDEIAFWPTGESATPDTEVLRGIRGGMANMTDPLLVCMSSPFAKRGELYEKYAAHWAKEDDPVLVWMADTVFMHDTPNIRAYVADMWRDDPVAAAAEVGKPGQGIQFREAQTDYIDAERLRAMRIPGREELPPCSRAPRRVLGPNHAYDPEDDPRFHYFAFVDTSGGSGDSFTLGIAHWDWRAERRPDGTPGVRSAQKAVMDYLRSWPAPFNPDAVVEEAARAVKLYGITHVTGDHYAAQWPVAAFGRHDIQFNHSTQNKSTIYREVLPCFNTGTAELLDHPVFLRQTSRLVRKVTSHGQEVIDHPPNERDDEANSGCGSLWQAYTQGRHMAPPEPEVVYATTQELQEREVQEIIEEMTGQGEGGRDLWHERWEE